MRDYGMEAQAAAEKHLNDCMAWLDYQESDGVAEAYGVSTTPGIPEGLVVDPASAPFDGCDTCVVREVLFAAWPIMVESAAG